MAKEIKAGDVKAINRELLDFINESPDAYHAVENMADMLTKAGFTRLYENDEWKIKPGNAYFTIRDGSSLIAFKMPKDKAYNGFQIMAAHSDSPAFKVKPSSEITVEDKYIKLNTEKYGGMIMYTWLDRPLSVAGRITVDSGDEIKTKLVKLDKDVLIIPSLAIHMDRTLNDGYAFNAQKDMLPLFAGKTDKKRTLMSLIAKEAKVKEEEILDADLYLYNRVKGTFLGADGEFIASARLDDIQCAFTAVKSIIDAEVTKSVSVCAIFNNEEVGSSTKQGAASSFLECVLERINASCGKSETEFKRTLVNSFLLSADNAHAVHPNHTDKADPTNRPYMNGGIVIKYNANQKYTSDAVSGGIFKKISKKAGVPIQTYVNRSDIAGGSTLGSIAVSRVSMNSVDIGLPQLAMHSAYETAGAHDTLYLYLAAKTFFESSITVTKDGNYKI